MMNYSKVCMDCGVSSLHHIQTWIDECLSNILPSVPLPQRLLSAADQIFERFFVGLGILEETEDIDLSCIQMRSACFIQEACKQEIKISGLRGRFGYTNQFKASFSDTMVRFESLPLAEHVSNVSFDTECKQDTKEFLKKKGFPVAEGELFFIGQTKKALRYGEQLGYPLVVKPKRGSVARHVTTHIKNREKLRNAIKGAIKYSPSFIIERYIDDAFVYRGTVIDMEHVYCVQQIPAHVVGDGESTIMELITLKNNDPARKAGRPHSPIVVNNTSHKLLAERGYNIDSVIPRGDITYLQRDPFLKLGGDLVEVSGDMHPDNERLFREIAESADIHVVGIDLCISDIKQSWKDQTSAVLELNSAPCIEMHHYPLSGEPQNPAAAVVELFFKYYQ